MFDNGRVFDLPDDTQIFDNEYDLGKNLTDEQDQIEEWNYLMILFYKMVMFFFGARKLPIFLNLIITNQNQLN